MTNEIAVVTAFFPAVQKYVGDLVSSLVAQSQKEFDWIIINDGGDEAFLMALVQNQLSVRVLNMQGLSPAENRWKTICWCKEKGYRYLVFQDADDWMGKYRIERSIDKMAEDGIVFCDLMLVNEEGELLQENIWADKFDNNSRIDHSFIGDKNCVGLGNAAVDLGKINGSIIVRPDIIAVDWLLFYQFMQTTKACFIDEPVYYRQYGNNLAGRKLLSRDSIQKCIEVKNKHYTALISQYPVLKAYVKELENFIGSVYSYKEKLEEYIYKHKSKSQTSLWWEETNYSYE